MPPDTRDEVVDFVRTWSDKTGVPACRFLLWLGLSAGKFHNWKQRFGQVNEHNAWVPRDHWLTPDEKERICAYARGNPFEGYRRLTTLSTLAQASRKGRNVGAPSTNRRKPTKKSPRS